jgi:hypothetical protein
MEAGSIWVRLGLDPDQLLFGLDKAKYGMQEWKGQTNQNSRDMAEWGAAIGATVAPLVAMGYAVVDLNQKFGGMAMELRDLSLQTGFTTDKLQDLKYAALLSGTSFGSVSMALNIMTRQMGDAEGSSLAAGTALKAFTDLGVDPRGRTPDEVFQAIAFALNNMDDPAQKAAAMQNVFGKNYKDMIPYIATYAEKQQEINSHVTFSQEDLQSMEEAKIAWDTLIDKITIYMGKVVAYQEIGWNGNYEEEPWIVGTYGAAKKKRDQAIARDPATISEIIQGGTIINIYNPKGTPAENAAAVTQASRDLARGV